MDRPKRLDKRRHGRRIADDHHGHAVGMQVAPPCQVPVMVKMPTQIDERIAWGQTRCWYFRNNFQDRVVKIHNEFADLHLEDNELNEFVGNTKYKDSPFTPVEIQLVAERLLVLASKVEK